LKREIEKRKRLICLIYRQKANFIDQQQIDKVAPQYYIFFSLH